MYGKALFIVCFMLMAATATAQPQAASPAAPPAPPAASDASAVPDAKLVRGMSVLGNDEAPMSLFIVPWKSSELGVETSLNRTLDERDVPVDRDVFMRELDFYKVSVGGKSATASHVANSR